MLTDCGAQPCLTDCGARPCLTDSGAQPCLTDCGAQPCLTDCGAQPYLTVQSDQGLRLGEGSTVQDDYLIRTDCRLTQVCGNL